MASRAIVHEAQSWAYQIQGALGTIARSSADVVVIDPDHAGPAAPFRRKADGTRRAVLAYLSIGEAETYRAYWQRCCRSDKPSWLTSMTQGWADNYVVRFWEPGWKEIVRTSVSAIMAKGYDGLYLDRVDTYESVEAPGGSRAAMIAFVKEIADYARSLKPDAAILVQNAEELLDSEGYVAVIDGIAKEDLLHGAGHDGNRNPPGMISSSVHYLKRAKKRGKAVFVVEYLSGQQTAVVAEEIRRLGFVPNFADRDLAN
jgi:cysteinyl-tRNA synthetase